MAAIPETPGQALETRHDGAGAVFGRSGRRRRTRTLGGQAGDGIHQPGDASPRRKSGRRSEEPERGSYLGDLPGPPTGRRPGVAGRHVDATSEGVGVSHPRSRMAEREAPRDHTTSKRIVVHGGRTRSSSETRAAHDEAPRGDDQGQRQQIGNRRRGTEILRDAIPEQPKSESIRQGEVRGQDHGDPSQPSEGREDKRGGEEGKSLRGRSRSGRRVEQEAKKKIQAARQQESLPADNERKGQRRRDEEVRERPQSDPTSCCQESECSTVMHDEEIENSLGTFRTWMKDHLPDGLGLPQLGAHLVLQLRKSPTAISRYLTRMLAEPSSV